MFYTAHIMPLVINALGGGHTDRHIRTHIPTCKPKQFQETFHAQPKAARAWFKNMARVGVHVLRQHEASGIAQCHIQFLKTTP